MMNLIALVPLTVVQQIQQQIADETLPPDQQHAISSRVDVTYRHPDGFMTFDFFTDAAGIEAMSVYDYTLVGTWDAETGELLSAFDEAAYLSAMPDEIETDEEGNVTSRTRPTAPRDIHLRAGQAPRAFA